MKKKNIYSLLTVLCLTISACTSGVVEAGMTGEALPVVSVEINEENAAAAQTISVDAVLVDADYDADDISVAVLSEDTTTIEFDGEMITIKGVGADLDGNVVTISSAGTYQLSGSLNDGQVVVNTQDDGPVSIIFNNVDITNFDSAPVYVLNAEKVVITLVENTTNSLTDGVSYVFADDEINEPNATLFSNDDLTINGTGSLAINANYKHGIVSNDDLKIVSGNITIDAVADGIKGKDLVVISDGVVSIKAGNDGIQSYNTKDVEKGNVLIEDGQISIFSGLDGIQAENIVEISGGDIDIAAGDDSTHNSTESAKGIKGSQVVLISDGMIIIDAEDDALNTNGSLVINNGIIRLSSGDDGIHADTSIEINGGETTILTSVEGIESANITLNEGNLIINSSDDGTNAVSGNGMGGGQDDGSSFIVNGGYLLIHANGDGLDSNGDAVINGGIVIVNGPSDNRNGHLDVNGTFEVNGGYLIAAGSSGMAETASTTSMQNSVAIVLDNVQSDGTAFRIETSNGEKVVNFIPEKNYQLVVFSSPDLESGQTYNLSIGGTQTANFTISSNVTTIGSFTSNMGGGGKGGGQRPGGGG
jgi:hypothetical protein